MTELITWEEKQVIAELIGFTHHKAQLPVSQSRARFKNLACGRRWGKTEILAFEHVCHLALGGIATGGAPTYDLCMVQFEVVQRMVLESRLRELVIDIRASKGDAFIGLSTGGRFTVKSYEKPRSWLARGRDFVGLDEAAQIKDRSIVDQYIRPSLSDRMGGMMAISTPFGEGYFKEEFDKGIRGEPGFQSFRAPSNSRPDFPRAEWIEAKRSLPDRIFRQEYEAEFLEGEGIVFRGFTQASTARWQDGPIPGHIYVVGVDLAIVDDFTVICIFDVTTRSVAHMIRINQVDYVLIEELIAEASRKWGFAPIIVDATNNDAVAQHLSLKTFWTEVVQFKFTQLSKREIIHSLSVAIENSEVALLDRDQNDDHARAMANHMADEFGCYGYDRTAAGTIRLGAPAGRHDDIPTAVALAYKLALDRGGTSALPAMPTVPPLPKMKGRFS